MNFQDWLVGLWAEKEAWPITSHVKSGFKGVGVVVGLWANKKSKGSQ